jgi:phosphate starvation-inducible PhoH-like protein
MASSPAVTAEVELNEQSALLQLTGPSNNNLKSLQKHLGVELGSRGNVLRLGGDADKVAFAQRFFTQMDELASEGIRLDGQDHVRALLALREDDTLHLRDIYSEVVLTNARGKPIKARGLAQKRYLHAMQTHDLTFGIGPAGTGKTYLAMAAAVAALLERRVKRIVLARPAVEAGEKLGFLPGDLAEKVDPYLRPLYDALHDMMEHDRANQLIEEGTIEVAPLAFMRGRTLHDSFAILDEAQNATVEQMKMFLTRLGSASQAVVTGDVTQIDLPPGKASGLVHARQALANINGIGMVEFVEEDVMRHPLVQEVIRAWDKGGKAT